MNFSSGFIHPCDNRKIHDGMNKAEILQCVFLLRIIFIIAVISKDDFSSGSYYSASQLHSQGSLSFYKIILRQFSGAVTMLLASIISLRQSYIGIPPAKCKIWQTQVLFCYLNWARKIFWPLSNSGCFKSINRKILSQMKTPLTSLQHLPPLDPIMIISNVGNFMQENLHTLYISVLFKATFPFYVCLPNHMKANSISSSTMLSMYKFSLSKFFVPQW